MLETLFRDASHSQFHLLQTSQFQTTRSTFQSLKLMFSYKVVIIYFIPTQTKRKKLLFQKTEFRLMIRVKKPQLVQTGHEGRFVPSLFCFLHSLASRTLLGILGQETVSEQEAAIFPPTSCLTWMKSIMRSKSEVKQN